MTEKVNWDDSYLLGITEIDDQHKKLLMIANELYEIANGSPETYKLKMSSALKKLTDYTVYHFDNEENYMRKCGYPGADMHKMAHDNFIKEVNYQVRQLSSDNIEAGIHFYAYVANWVMTHIAKADKIWATVVKKS
ncbi:MAG: hemerythrin family protein [Spirochaetales bacterium]|nr:hemerythrin family protein [Spirochaetales bacterium]